MRKQSIYLETTIFNFVFADDAPEKKHATLQLMAEIQAGKKFEPYTSLAVVDELLKAQPQKRDNMFSLITDYDVNVLETDEEVFRLANTYVAKASFLQNTVTMRCILRWQA